MFTFAFPMSLTFDRLILQLHHHSLAWGVTLPKNMNVQPCSNTEWTKAMW